LMLALDIKRNCVIKLATLDCSCSHLQGDNSSCIGLRSAALDFSSIPLFGSVAALLALLPFLAASCSSFAERELVP